MASSIAITNTASLWGIEAHLVTVEVEVSSGTSYFNIVGLPDNIIRESRDRIFAALNYLLKGFYLYKVIVNLAPVDLKKQGTGFDLPLAVAILAANSNIPKEKIIPINFKQKAGDAEDIQNILKKTSLTAKKSTNFRRNNNKIFAGRICKLLHSFSHRFYLSFRRFLC